MKRSIVKKSLVVYLALAIFFVAFPADLYAMFIPSSAGQEVVSDGNSPSRGRDLQNVQKTLESKIVQQRLADLGLTAEEISTRIGSLSNHDLHQLSTRIDQMQTGGGDDGLGFLIALLVIAILVVVLLQVSGHRVIVTR